MRCSSCSSTRTRRGPCATGPPPSRSILERISGAPAISRCPRASWASSPPTSPTRDRTCSATARRSPFLDQVLGELARCHDTLSDHLLRHLSAPCSSRSSTGCRSPTTRSSASPSSSCACSRRRRAHQTLSSFVLAVGPPTKVSRYRDWNDNAVHHFTIVNFHDRIEVSARSFVSTTPGGPGLAAATDVRPAAEPPYPLLDFLDFGGPVRNSAALRKFAQAVSLPSSAPLGEQVARLWPAHPRTLRLPQERHALRLDDGRLPAGSRRGSARTSPT